MPRETLDQLLENANKSDMTNYSLTYLVTRELLERYDNRTVDMICDVFKIGFLKGQRSERARRRRVQHG